MLCLSGQFLKHLYLGYCTTVTRDYGSLELCAGDTTQKLSLILKGFALLERGCLLIVNVESNILLFSISSGPSQKSLLDSNKIGQMTWSNIL